MLIKEITAMSKGHRVSEEVKSQAIALGQTINVLDQFINQMTHPSM